MSEIRSFPRCVRDLESARESSWVYEPLNANLRADLIVREPGCRDVDCPPVGSMVRTLNGVDVEVVSGPFMRNGGPSVAIRWPNGGTNTSCLSALTLIPETKTFRATYKGKDEADVRRRFGLDGVELEEVTP